MRALCIGVRVAGYSVSVRLGSQWADTLSLILLLLGYVMKQKAAILLCCLASLPVWAQTANVDALLLSAQMAYQDADSKQDQARRRLLQVEEELKQAQKRLLDAQQLQQQAEMAQQQALADKAAADALMQQATQRLRDAWQQKEGQ